MTYFEQITNFQHLYKAFQRSKSGKGYKQSAAKFEMRALEGIQILKQRLESKTYQVAAYHEFKIYEPKERLIMAGAFQDKIVQHSLCDNVLLPLLKSEFIVDNYAGQLGKGTLFGLNRLSTAMTSFYKEHGMNGYILKGDITKFFYTIDHDILKDIIAYHVSDQDVYWLCEQFINSTIGIGIPLGNQTSQVFALLYLNGLDHFITSDLGIKYYGRYMDDFFLIHYDRDYLKECLFAIQKFVHSLRLTLNGKTQIMPFKNGINFLGFHTYITKDGNIIRKLKNSNKRNAQKKFRKMIRLVESGQISKEQFKNSYNAWENHASHGNCYKLTSRMDQKYKTMLARTERK